MVKAAQAEGPYRTAAPPPVRKTYGRCSKCGEPVRHHDRRFCRACYVSQSRPTPLRRWRATSGRDFRWLAEQSRVGYRTILRIAAGASASSQVAMKLHRVTRIPLADLIGGSG